MILNWFHLVIIYIFTNSISKLIQKSFLKDDNIEPTAFSAFYMFLVGVVSISYLFFEDIAYPSDTKIWLAVLLSGLFYTICMMLFYHALQGTEVSQVETISTTRSVWMMILGVIFFQEMLTLSSFLGVFLIFTGLVVIYWNKGQFKGFAKPHLYTLLYAFFISCAYALDKYVISYFSVGLYQVVIYILPAVFTVIFLPRTLENIKYLCTPRKSSCVILISSVFQAVSTLALYGAYKFGGQLSVVGPLAQTSTVVTIAVGMIVLKEKWNLKRKIVGILITLMGVFFIKFISF